MSNKLVVVVGATGTQGGSVVAAFLRHGGYTVRGLTRNTDAPAAQSLKAQGVEVVSADLADKASLVKAFQGAYAVFGVSIAFTKDSETLQGRNIVDACKANDVPLLVWSSLPSATELSQGKYTTLQHFDQKQAVDQYIASAQQPGVVLRVGGFADNLLTYHQFARDPSDASRWVIAYPVVRPSVHISTTWVERDLGNMVTAVIDKWDEPAWRERLTREGPILAVSHRVSGQEMVDSIKRITGKEVSYYQVMDLPPYQKTMFQFGDDGYFNYPGPNPPQILAELGVETHSFDDYVREKLVPFMQQEA